jgi:Fur family ferric uptake transcriptional regulator
MDAKGVDAGLLQSKYRLTKQRAAILHALADGSHLRAETIHERVRGMLSGVSLGTVYRTLEILREIGLVQMFAYGGGPARYEAALDKHHHLLCTTCDDIRNVRVDDVAHLAETVAREHAFANVDAALVITGTCDACAAARKPG